MPDDRIMARKTSPIQDIVDRQALHERADNDRFTAIQRVLDEMAPQVAKIYKYFDDEQAVNVYKVNLKKFVIWILSAAVATLTIVTLLLELIKWWSAK